MSNPALPPLTLILGGARSGKSIHAERLLTTVPAPWAYIATAEPFDDEMRERISVHKERRGNGWIEYETPLDLAGTLGQSGCRPTLPRRLPDALALEHDARRPEHLRTKQTP